MAAPLVHATTSVDQRPAKSLETNRAFARPVRGPDGGMPSKSCRFARAGGFLCKQEVAGSIPVGSTREVPANELVAVDRMCRSGLGNAVDGSDMEALGSGPRVYDRPRSWSSCCPTLVGRRGCRAKFEERVRGELPVTRPRAARGTAAIDQAPAGAIEWLWSLRRLWIATWNRHSERAAALPRRWKRRKPRLNLFCANTGSTVAFRCL